MFNNNSPQHREDYKSSQKTGQAIDAAGDERIAIAVVVELVVAGKRQQSAEARAQRKEDLRGGIYPYLGILKLMPLRRQIVLDALIGARQANAAYQQNDEHNIGCQRSDPYHLAGAAYALPQRKVDQHENAKDA